MRIVEHEAKGNARMRRQVEEHGDRIHWQKAEDLGSHVYLPGMTKSACGRYLLHERNHLVDSPPPKAACLKCAKALQSHLGTGFLDLPVEVLGGRLHAAILGTIRRVLGKTTLTVGDLLDLSADKLMGEKGRSLKSVARVQNALRPFGLSMAKPPTGFRMVKGPSPLTVDRQTARILDLVGEEMVRKGTLQAIGDKLGVSRERVRQLFQGNPALMTIRGESVQARREDLRSRTRELFLTGLTIDAVSESLGVHPATILKWAQADKDLRWAINMGRRARDARQRREDEERVRRVAEVAVAKGASLLGACVELGEDYRRISRIKTRFPALLVDPEFRRILDPVSVHKELASRVRDRVVNNHETLRSACEAEGIVPATCRRCLVGDAEFNRAIFESVKARGLTARHRLEADIPRKVAAS